MQNYSIRYLDAFGVTKNSELLSFENNVAATGFARIGLIRNAIVDVWADNHLIVRLHQERPRAEGAEVAEPRAADVVDDLHEAVDDWDNDRNERSPLSSNIHR